MCVCVCVYVARRQYVARKPLSRNPCLQYIELTSLRQQHTFVVAKAHYTHLGATGRLWRRWWQHIRDLLRCVTLLLSAVRCLLSAVCSLPTTGQRLVRQVDTSDGRPELVLQEEGRHVLVTRHQNTLLTVVGVCECVSRHQDTLLTWVGVCEYVYVSLCAYVCV
jgi:hypothetical protein